MAAPGAMRDMRTSDHTGRGLAAPFQELRPGGRDRRRGAALLMIIIVLTALFLLALPFAVLMRLQHTAATQALNTDRAASGEAGALSQARVVLSQKLLGMTAFPFNNPSADSLWQFHVTLCTTVTDPNGVGPPSADQTFEVGDALGLSNDSVSGTTDSNPETVDGYIRVDDEWMAYSQVQVYSPTNPGPLNTPLPGGQFPAGLITVKAANRGLFGTSAVAHNTGALVSLYPGLELWHLEVQDQQAKINVNTAPYRVVLNLLGYLHIGGNSPDDPPTGDPNVDFGTTGTPRQQGIAAAISSYRIYSSQWKYGASAPLTYNRFENLNMVKDISVAPWFTSSPGGTVAPLQPDEYDRLLPYLTVNSEWTSGSSQWIPVSGLAAGLNTGTPGATAQWAARLNDASRVPIGSVVRLFDPSQPNQLPAYRLVTAVNRDVTLTAAILDGNPGTVTVDNSTGVLAQFRQVKPTNQQPPAEPYTPGYLYIDDGPNSEWVAYSNVDPGAGTIYLSQRGQFNTVAGPHALGTMMRGNVISWRYMDPASGAQYAPMVPDSGPNLLTFTIGSNAEIENRHAININTVTDPLLLKAIVNGMSDGTVTIGLDATGNPAPAEVQNVATSLLGHTSGGDNTFFDGNEAWFTSTGDLDSFINTLAFAGGNDAQKQQMLIQNFDANTPGAWPAVSTVPLRFNSGTLIGLDSMAIADDQAFTPIAQEPRLPLSRVNDVVPPLEPLFWALRTQKEFYDECMLASKQAFTTPLKEDISQILLNADAKYTDRHDGIGTVAPRLDMLNPVNTADPSIPSSYATAVLGLHRSPPQMGFDYSAAGYYVAPDTPTTANTTAEGIKNVRLPFPTDYDNPAGARHIEASAFDATIQPFAVEFWIKPTDVTSRQLLVDIGTGTVPAADDDPTGCNVPNQARLYFDPAGTGLNYGNIVLRLDEPVANKDLGYAGWVEARSSASFPFEPGKWHHVAVAAVGTFRNEIAMFIDGIYDRQMGWAYTYVDPNGIFHSKLSAREGDFSPVAIQLPNSNTMTVASPLPGGQWPTGWPIIGLQDAAWLPPKGWVVIGTAAHAYEYSAVNLVTNTITLVPPGLQEPHNPGEYVALMIPMLRCAHTDAYNVPADTDVLSLQRFTQVNPPNGGYSIVTSTTTYQMGSVSHVGAVRGASVDPILNRYIWLGIPPGGPGGYLAGVGNSFDPADHWKVLVKRDEYYAVSPPVGVLSGSLPSGDIGAGFSIGGDRTLPNPTQPFTGELDELRISALPIAVSGGWAAGLSSVTVQQWGWQAEGSLGNLQALQLFQGAALDMKPGLALQPTGGYFVVDGRLYSYTSYDPNPLSPTFGTISGIVEVNDDLTAKSPNLAAPVNAFHRIIPLNFIAASTLAADYAITDVDIPVASAGLVPPFSAFPEEGYVQIDNEIIAYSRKDYTPGNGFAYDRLLRPTPVLNPGPPPVLGVSSFPRGAYGTLPADHTILPQAPVVRHLPVRHLDRYRAETAANTWNMHTQYTGPQLGNDMCMLTYLVTHPGKLSGVYWRFKKPLEDNQKVAVLVLVDNDVAWQTNPAASGDKLFGKLSQGNISEDKLNWLDFGGPVDVANNVQVRFYFDLSGAHAYGWSNMAEVDRLQVEMVPTPTTF